jgi:hypothetical protein
MDDVQFLHMQEVDKTLIDRINQPLEDEESWKEKIISVILNKVSRPLGTMFLTNFLEM